MGRHKLSKSLIQQVKENLDSKLAIGESKYMAKKDGTYTQHIYSWDTYRSYLKHCCYFVKWCKAQPIDPTLGHKPRTIAECRRFAEKWIQSTMDRGLSAYTVKLELSSLAKLYGCKTTDFAIVTPPRKRQNITRSRGNAVRDKHFSVENNKDLITFCKCTGLRRAELAQIRGTDLIVHEGRLCLDIKRGTKGGRLRISPVIGSEEEIEMVKNLCIAAGDNKVFPKPSENADIHSYRAVYAQRIYDLNKREYKDFRDEILIIHKGKFIDSYKTKNDKASNPYFHLTEKGKYVLIKGYKTVSSVYYCRNDQKGKIFDRKALLEASLALGHGRIGVISAHYLNNI